MRRLLRLLRLRATPHCGDLRDDRATVTPDQIRRENLHSLAWLAEFRRRQGRPLRILHIGNIANNGYNNAKHQRAYGIEADTVCYDYYHVTGTPEWENADFVGDVDPDLPDWWAVKFRGWRRPDWFVQGPLQACLEHLRARQLGRTEHIRLTRHGLLNAYWNLLEESARRRGVSRPPLPDGQSLPSAWGGTLWDRLLPRKQWPRWWACRTSPAALSELKAQARRLLRDPALRRQFAGQRLGLLDRAVLLIRPASELSTPEIPTAEPRSRSRLGIAVRLVGVSLLARLATAFGTADRTRMAEPRDALPREPSALASERRQRALTALERLYATQFPSANDSERETDLAAAALEAAPWIDILDYYDIVQGYSTTGSIPLFNGFERYTAFEHGTIRVIPFEDNTRGRLCRLTYKLAPRVFITNTDVLPSVDRIGIEKQRAVYLPAAFDIAAVQTFRDRNPKLLPPVDHVVFFCAARHHWHDGDGSWLKGNDVFLRAAGELAAGGARFRMILVEWGPEVDRSKALIEQLGFPHLVEWVPLQRKAELWKSYCEAHAVIDQFALPAMGGVSLEALALGRRLITRIDVPTLRHFFGAAPPVLHGATGSEVAQRMAEVIADPADKAGIGAAGRAWINSYHSTETLVARQVSAYRAILEGSDRLRL